MLSEARYEEQDERATVTSPSSWHDNSSPKRSRRLRATRFDNMLCRVVKRVEGGSQRPQKVLEMSVESDGIVVQPVRQILRLEGALLLVALMVAYWFVSASWVLFIVLVFAPDLAMLGYLRNTRLGAWCYNTSHTLVGPILLDALSVRFHSVVSLALIWAAHIAMDRALGYGLKYEDPFGHTHLGQLQKPKALAVRR